MKNKLKKLLNTHIFRGDVLFFAVSILSIIGAVWWFPNMSYKYFAKSVCP